MPQRDWVALVMALVIFAAPVGGLVYFVRELWPRLPPWLSLLVFIALAVMVIGYPIYSLARWSDRALARQRAQKLNDDKDSSGH